MSFHSRRRDVVFPQAEHARFAGLLAAQWAEPVPVPLASFVRGVAEHDRGYGELDDDALGQVGNKRWVEIQRRGFAPRGEDTVTDLVVALHVRRLLSPPESGAERAAHSEVDTLVAKLLETAGVSGEDASAADAVTNVCDVLSLMFCFETAAELEVRGFQLRADGVGGLWAGPWPFASDELRGDVVGYLREGYPERLVRVSAPYVVRPGSHG